jgi:hypothetical protein
MSVKIAEISDVPAALPISERDEDREKLLREAADAFQRPDENLPVEIGAEELEESSETPRSSKKKLFFAFALFVLGFALLVLLMSWFFRLGAFAAAEPQAVDRTAKTNSPDPAPATEEEKLKRALDIVAEKNTNGNAAESPNGSETLRADSSFDIPPIKAADLNEPVIVPDPLVEANRNPVDSLTPLTGIEPGKKTISTVSGSVQSSPDSERINDAGARSDRDGNNAPIGRGLFFGIERREISPTLLTDQTNAPIAARNESVNYNDRPTPPIPFGTLLPIRFLGAVYTLRSSGGLVRMELTRSVSGKNYSYPAGTVLVGSLRGSEERRAFISVVGLIDPASGGLVKLTGELMGVDGASGVAGRKRQIKSTWSRVLKGLRETGAAALGAIGNARSGGTVVISDGASKASGVLTNELSGLIGNNRDRSEFVEISAGTTAFVLVTDLPAEISDAEYRAGQNTKGATGLTDTESANLLSFGDKEKIRAALPLMTPRFRVSAEK